MEKEKSSKLNETELSCPNVERNILFECLQENIPLVKNLNSEKLNLRLEYIRNTRDSSNINLENEYYNNRKYSRITQR